MNPGNRFFVKQNSRAVQVLVIVLSAIALFYTEGLVTAKRIEKEVWYEPPPILQYLHFGYRPILADTLWIQVIQRFEACTWETLAKQYYQTIEELAQSERNEQKLKQLCQKSWQFKVLEMITKLDRKYSMVYRSGAIILSVIVNDVEGASYLFDIGVNEYPDDWALSYRAAYHAQFEEGNDEKAAKLLIQSHENGGPFWLKFLAARLYTESGKKDLAKATLESMKSVSDNPDYQSGIRHKMKQLKIDD